MNQPNFTVPTHRQIKSNVKKLSIYGIQFAYTVSCNSLVLNSLHYLQHQELVSASFYLRLRRNSILGIIYAIKYLG